MSPDSRRSTEEPPLYQEFEHTGDLGIDLSAPTRDELFRRATVALASLLVEIVDVKTSEERAVAVAADTDADLMHDLLMELLKLFTVEAFIWRGAEVVDAGRGL